MEVVDMLLSADIIATALDAQWTLSAKSCRQRNLSLNPPRIWQPKHPLLPDTVYILDSSDALADMPTEWNGLLILCASGLAAPLPTCQTCSLICIAEPCSVFEALNSVQQVFADYLAWDLGLRDLLYREPDAQKLLEACLPMIRGDLGMSDGKLGQVALAQRQSAPLNAPLSTLWLQKNIQRLAKIMRSTRELREVYDVPQLEEMTGQHTISLNIFDGHIMIGCLYAHSETDFRPQDYALLSHIGVYARHLLRHYPQSSDSNLRHVRDIFAAMLRSEHLDCDILERACMVVGFDKKDIYRCLSIEAPLRITAAIKHYICERLAAIIPATVAIEHDGRIAVLINHTKAEAELPDYMLEAGKLLKHVGLQAGLSDFCGSMHEIRCYYLSAEAALMTGKEAGDCGRIFPFDRYAMLYALNHCKGDLKPHMIYPTGLKRLIAHDSDSQASFVETLGVYLEEGQNATRAAKRLFLHRSSFQARLERILSILGDDLQDPDMRNHLGLCIRLHRMQKRRDIGS
jgi:hypothetical protein